jgi:hypothetical protein
MLKHILVMVITLSLAMTSAAHAGQITNLQLFDGGAAPTATLTYTNADGTGTNVADFAADPQVSYGTAAPLYYCVDLWHDNNIGDTYTITPVSSMLFANSAYSDADNRIGWLLNQDQSTALTRAAVQLAIWYTVDNKPGPGASPFSMSVGDPTITNDYNTLITFAGYDPATNYAAQFWQATHDASNTLYQDVVSAPPFGIGIYNAAVPEPASLVQAALGGLVLLGGIPLKRRWTRKKRANIGPAG